MQVCFLASGSLLQARSAGVRLQLVPWSAIVASDEKEVVEAAGAVAAENTVGAVQVIQEDPRLCARRKGESLEAVSLRLGEFIRDIRRGRKGGIFLVVADATLIWRLRNKSARRERLRAGDFFWVS